MASEMFMNQDRIRDIIKASKQYLQVLYENDFKLMLKVQDVPTIEVKVDDEGSTLSINILEPEKIAGIVQQFRVIMG